MALEVIGVGGPFLSAGSPVSRFELEIMQLPGPCVDDWAVNVIDGIAWPGVNAASNFPKSAEVKFPNWAGVR
jgi:hypothetical protein